MTEPHHTVERTPSRGASRRSRDPYRNFLWLFAAFTVQMALVGLVINALYIVKHPDVESITSQIWRDRPISMLLFGDSVATSIGPCDSGRDTLQDWVQHTAKNHPEAQKLAQNMVFATSASFYPPVYNDILNLMLSLNARIQTVVIAINPRSFSEEWYSMPSRRNELFRATLRVKTGIATLLDYYQIAKYTYSDTLNREINQWLGERVTYPDHPLGIRSQFNREIKPDLECHPELRDKYHDALKIKYIYHYMYVLNESHEVLQALRTLMGNVRAAGARSVVYLTPINMEDGVALVGPEFKQRVARNRAVIHNVVEREGGVFLDWSDALPRDRFVDQRLAVEHLDNAGRQWLGEALVTALTALYH
ncbi:MAG: hypothetical protein HQL77_14220 [Magnetococcales bacterium]|nr:hypothetical protein [Magnetococcales bacterium]